jgi:hypothetical protein
MTIYVFGYGALLNLKTVKEFSQPKKSWPVLINGLKRSLNVMGQRHLVFGVKEVKTAWCNGLLIKVNENELARLQEREKLYTMKTIDKKRVDFSYKKTLQFKPADQIVCFYPQAKYVLTKKELVTKIPLHIQSQHYVDNCKTGAAAVSTEFYEDFLETTTTPV